MSFKNKNREITTQQKHTALVPIKSVHSNFILEKSHTKRVKVINDEKQHTSRRIDTKAEAMLESQSKTAAPNRHLQKRLERAFNVLSVSYSDTSEGDTSELLYGAPVKSKSASAAGQRNKQHVLGRNGKQKKISAKLEFDSCIFNNNSNSEGPVEEGRVQSSSSKKKQHFPVLGGRPEQALGNKTKLYGEEVYISSADPAAAPTYQSKHRTSSAGPVNSGRKYSVFKNDLKEYQSNLAVVGFQRVLSKPSTCTFLKRNAANSNE